MALNGLLCADVPLRNCSLNPRCTDTTLHRVYIHTLRFLYHACLSACCYCLADEVTVFCCSLSFAIFADAAFQICWLLPANCSYEWRQFVIFVSGTQTFSLFVFANSKTDSCLLTDVLDFLTCVCMCVCVILVLVGTAVKRLNVKVKRLKPR